MRTTERFYPLLICLTRRVIHLFHTYLWIIYYVPGMVLSVRLSEFLVKTTDKAFLLGIFPDPLGSLLKWCLSQTWCSSVPQPKFVVFYFLLWKKKKKKGNVKWLHENSSAGGQGTHCFFPPLLCRSSATLSNSATMSSSLCLSGSLFFLCEMGME